MQLRVTLHQLIRWHADENQNSWPAWLAFVHYYKHVPQPAIREDDCYAERRWREYHRACITVPKHVEACPYTQDFTFGVANSPDVFVMRIEPRQAPRLYRQETKQVEVMTLVPV